MSRIYKAGIDYFSRNTGFYKTPKMRTLRRNYGATGILLLEMLESEAYSEYGYFLPISDEDLIFSLCDDLAIEVEEFEEIIQFLIDRSFFVELDHWEHGKVITSKEMQENFFPVARERARKRADHTYPVDSDIWLLPEVPRYQSNSPQE